MVNAVATGKTVSGERTRGKTLKAGLVLLIVSALLALILEGLQMLSMPRQYSYSVPLNYKEAHAWDDRLLYMVNYEWAEGELHITGGDPQMYFSTGDIQGLRTVFLKFMEPAPSDIAVQLFYAENPGYYAEAQSVKSTCPAGSLWHYIPLPRSSYAEIRLDLDFNGSSTLESVIFSEEEPVRTLVEEPMNWLRVIMVAVILFIMLSLLAWMHAWERFRETVRGAREGLKATGKKSILYALLFPAAAAAAIGIGAVCLQLAIGKPMTTPLMVFFGLVGLNLAALVTFRKTLRDHPEYLYLIVCISIGLLFCLYIPHTGLNGWDEEYHYKQALKASYVDELRMTAQDDLPIFLNGWDSFDLNGGLVGMHEKQNDLYRAGAMAVYNTTFVQPQAVPECLNAIGLFLGRVLGLEYYQTLILGRLTGMLAYALAGFFAIRKLKSGKMIAAVCMLIPTSLFLSGTFNYDIYLTAFSLLGISYYIAQWQNREEKMTNRDAFVIIGSLTFACIVKAVYVPLLWIVLFLPRDKFRNRKHQWSYFGCVLAGTVIIVMSYLAPNLVRGGNGLSTDARGGGDVNAGAQLSLIFSDPMGYARVLWTYLRDSYLNTRMINLLLTNMAYHGLMPHEHLYLILMFVVAFTDKNEADQPLVRKWYAHIVPLVLTFGTLVLIVTSMYLAFTPVGAQTVNGAQHRYMIPLVYPLLAFIGSGLVHNRMNRGWYNALVLTTAGFVGYACVFSTFVVRYF